MKHAGSAPKVTVRVDCRADELRVSIRDFGRGSDGTDPGHGLIGMRERVGLFDGTLTAGPVDRGFRVAARLPLVEGT